MPIYFAQAGEGGHVKIGWAVNPEARIAILQTGHHENLQLLRTVEGDRKTEAAIHRRFGHSRIRGEWFRFDQAMLSDDLVRPPRQEAISLVIRPESLVSEIDAFLEEAQMSPTAFGRDALGDPGFVFGLRAGRDCRASTFARARAQMQYYRKHGEFTRRPSRCASRSPRATG